ncbi:MAG: riboflavin biosynthesis protein RibF [Proteobacteria bacterium]|nr:riboflavin biosynthesis protein RibF [Pseudomonadota bacterium]
MTTILTIGNFDGLHLGHRHLITMTIELARSWGARAIAITFTPHPRQYFHPVPHFLIHPEQIKEQILESLGLDEVSYLPFGDIHTLTPREFFDNILLPLEPAAIVLGSNFNFGAGKAGNIDMLREFCAEHDIALHSLTMASWNGAPVSSSRIRTAIQTGHVEDATAMLSEPYSLYGIVEHGARRGHTVGFATANIHAPEQVMPRLGVYSSHVQIDNDKTYEAVTAITQTPTFGTVETLAESHIFGFDGDIYGHSVRVSFNHFIREEMRFRSLEEFTAQLKEDCERARALHELGASCKGKVS